MRTALSVMVAAMFFCAAFADDALAQNERLLKKGYIRTDQGKKCWYTQTEDLNSHYFSDKLTWRVATIRFDDPTCMSPSGAGQEVNKMMINNILSGWYSHTDASFMTRVSEMFPTSMFQQRGQCIQSKTYPAIGIVVDYVMKDGNIVAVHHGGAIQGCKKD